jgi:FkbM family methyltransferase
MELNPRIGADYQAGRAEPAVSAALEKHLRPGMVFYDLGANIGFYSLAAARLVAEEGKVYCFEPDPEVFGWLQRNIERNSSSNIHAVNSGVWSKTSSVHFQRSDTSISPGRGSGMVVSSPAPGACIDVPSYSLDDFVREAPPPDLIKCDVEGAEVEVFKGARRLLSEHHPMIVCELHSENNRIELRKFLEDIGYGVQVLDENHIFASYS